MKVRHAIEKLLQFDMDAHLMIGVSLKGKSREAGDELFVPVGDVKTFTTDRHGREVVFDCPIDLEIENSVTLKEQG